jgi:putative glycosyltransferase (TIGR04372 family)
MLKKIFKKTFCITRLLFYFLFEISSYKDLSKLIKFIYLNKNKIRYYQIRKRYGQFASGFYLSLSNFRNDSVIFYLEKNIIYQNFNEDLKKIFVNNNCLFIESEFLYQIIRLLYKNNKSEEFILRYHPNETLKSKNIFNYDITQYLKYEDNNSIKSIIYKNFLNKFNVKKIIIFSIKEKEYYSSYKKVFKNYTQPNYEFDSFDRLHKVIKYLCDKNYLVIRSGRNLKKTTFSHNLFFDYASSQYNNLANDIYLASIADFLIGNQTGYDVLCFLWFKKKIFYYQIRCYKYLLHFPNIFFLKMNIKKGNATLSVKDQIKIESLLWKTEDANELYKNLNDNGYKVSQLLINNIIININIFFNINSKKINNFYFYNLFLKYYTKEYKKLGRYLPVYQANLISNS